MKLRKLLYVALPLLLVSGCATMNNPYSERGFNNVSYSLGRASSRISDLNHSMERPNKSSLAKFLDFIY